jgi:type II secretory pathway predicted ATPase ExeA
MLTADIMNHFGIEKDWEAVGFFETAEHKQLATNVRNAILAGRLVAITGPTGVGKTLTLNRLQAAIAAENKVIVARSLSIEKARLVLPSLMTALFLDVSDDLATKVPPPSPRSGNVCCRSCLASARSLSCCSLTKRMICTATRSWG